MRFEKSCHYCGARFEVSAPTQWDHAQALEYACPECGKHYEIEARGWPEVQLLLRRTDGKHDGYQETMF